MPQNHIIGPVGKLKIGQIRRSLKLIHMNYSPVELAGLIAMPIEEIELACAKGCPYVKDIEENIWIVGKEFLKWYGIKPLHTTSENSPLINRYNYLNVIAFLSYRENVIQNDQGTIRRIWISLKHLLEWAREIPFSEASSIMPVFPEFLLSNRMDGNESTLNVTSLDRICAHSRTFFNWAYGRKPAEYRGDFKGWIDTIRPRRSNGIQTEFKKREYWELDDVKKIAQLQLKEVGDKRDQAAICFLFLSGMRVTAFLTLGMNCVDISKKRVEQLPSKGVRTKNRTAGITSFLPIPELSTICEDWDNYLYERVEEGLWYPSLTRMKEIDTHKTALTSNPAGRRMILTQGMRRLCKMAGVPYKSPHKLRHGHANYGMKHAKTIQELKALSQNLMHSSISITDGIYGNLKEEDIRDTLATFTDKQGPGKGDSSNAQDIFNLFLKMQQNPDLLKKFLDA